MWFIVSVNGPVAQWIRHLTTNQGIAGSSPARVAFFPVPREECNFCLVKYHPLDACLNVPQLTICGS